MIEHSEPLPSLGFSEAEIPLHLDRLRTLPFVSMDDLKYTAFHSDEQVEEVTVPLERIIGGNKIANWSDIGRGDHRSLARKIAQIKDGSFHYEDARPDLLDWGGAYVVLNGGNTRCGIAKLIGMDPVPVTVHKALQLDTVAAFQQEEYDLLFQRREQGLWTGNLEIIVVEGMDFYARGEVKDYEGVWVFSKDMDKVKTLYSQIGASGKL